MDEPLREQRPLTTDELLLQLDRSGDATSAEGQHLLLLLLADVFGIERINTTPTEKR
jgi:hypothetical protein